MTSKLYAAGLVLCMAALYRSSIPLALAGAIVLVGTAIHNNLSQITDTGG